MNKAFDYNRKWEELLSPEIVGMLLHIREFKDKPDEYDKEKITTLKQLVEIAKIQSAEASNRIEGIHTTDERLKALVKDKIVPKNRGEKEIAGYRDVLNIIHENYNYIPIKPNTILQLHRDLYKYEGVDIGGKYKNSENVIEEEDSNGNKIIRFQPLAAWETPEAIEKICDNYNKAINDDVADPLLVTIMFIFDFLCIHPFKDGNGRMSRLLTLLMLYRIGYVVGKYISIEKLIENTKENYYLSLEESSKNWHEDKNDYKPFVKYMLGIILAAYRDLMSREEIINKKITKPERIEDLIKNTYGEITKTKIMETFNDISQITVQRTLAELLAAGKIIKIGGGRYTKYVWNRNKE